ncbi:MULTISPECIES: amidohydrolase [Arthrobacter]|uniref:Amidohydrolase n=2 Tax=Arthrobacter TaxID=1663 RepID=A0ABU9KHK2_9MICC|nr:amidohydrolase [Arthrobacter sp. YJM1]MDP5226609.1 amidohydrolase [Arthrobacter sp. YJM1]
MVLTVFHGGTISTGVPGTAPAAALAVQDGRIVAIGEDAEALLERAEEAVDLQGAFLGPSFADGHAHPLFGGMEGLGPQIRRCASVEEIVAEVARYAAAHPEQEWIVGASYDATLAEGGLFDAAWLDAVVPDRPVMLKAWDYHTVWVNSAALRAAGIDADTPDPDRGRIIRRADGTPLGTLQEYGALELVENAAPGYSLERRISALEDATRTMAASGLTWAQDAWVMLEHVDVYLEAARQGRLNTRLNLAFLAEPGRWQDSLATFTTVREQVNALGGDLLTANTVKFFADGIIESHTACMLSPYTDAPEDKGLPNWEQNELNDALAAVDALGFQAHIHAIGDGAIRMALDGVEETGRRNGPRDRRPVLAHLQVIDPLDVPRFAELGVVANFEPLWAREDDVMNLLTVPRLGGPRSELQYPIGSLIERGVHVSFGSDWPVTCHEPVPGLATAVTRQTPDHLPAGGWLPAERIDVDAALTAYTAGVAYQAFAEGEWGALRPGMSADLVQLSHDPRAVPTQELQDLRVLGTWLAGRRTHAALLPTTR